MPGHLYHPGNQARTGARSPKRGLATGPAAVLALQRQVGNRAVRRTLARAPSLNESAPTGTFTAEALKYFNDPANKTKGIGEYAQYLATKANVPLKALGVPEMKIDYDSGAPQPGAFWHDTWKIIMNTVLWSQSRTAQNVAACDDPRLVTHRASP